MTAVQLRFDYAALEPETRRFVLERAERIHNLARMTAAAIVQIGQYLTEVKARLGHGKFLEWIEREFAWGDDSARRFMRVHEQFKNRNLRNLEIDVSALYLIAAPSTPERVREEVIRRAAGGEAVTHMGARCLVQEFADTGQLPEIVTPLSTIIERRRVPVEPEERTIQPEEREATRRLREEVKTNSAHATVVMDVIRSIEVLTATPLSVAQIAFEIRRLDTPDKDWRGQTDRANRLLTALWKELNR